jgi:hypothetical protein
LPPLSPVKEWHQVYDVTVLVTALENDCEMNLVDNEDSRNFRAAIERLKEMINVFNMRKLPHGFLDWISSAQKDRIIKALGPAVPSPAVSSPWVVSPPLPLFDGDVEPTFKRTKLFA